MNRTKISEHTIQQPAHFDQSTATAAAVIAGDKPARTREDLTAELAHVEHARKRQCDLRVEAQIVADYHDAKANLLGAQARRLQAKLDSLGK